MGATQCLKEDTMPLHTRLLVVLLLGAPLIATATGTATAVTTGVITGTTATITGTTGTGTDAHPAVTRPNSAASG